MYSQAINNLQSTVFGFGHVNSENVFKVCDEPHPVLIRDMIERCVQGDLDEAYKAMNHLWRLGSLRNDCSLALDSTSVRQVTRLKTSSR